MTGMENLKVEMMKRGLNSSQVNSKVVPVLLDIISNSSGEYLKAWEDERDARDKVSELGAEVARLERRKTMLIADCDTATAKITKLVNETKAYLEEVNKSLQEMETAEGRDAFRCAQMFANTVDIDSKYDNTAFIIGLASILSRGNIAAISELKKINKCIPDLPQSIKTLTWTMGGERI